VISNLKKTKFYFENMFATKWSGTPIHFVGQEYDATGVDSWINPRFVPTGGRVKGIGGGTTRLNGELDVVCWGENEVDAYDLADRVVDFVESNANDISITQFEINDIGWNTSNMVYVVLTFVFTYYRGSCGPIVITDCSLSIGGDTGKDWKLVGTWQPTCTMFKAGPIPINALYDGADPLFDGAEQLLD